MLPKLENELTVARLLGISAEEAAQRLSRRVAITSAARCCWFSTEIGDQVGRTLTLADGPEEIDVEIIVHGRPATTARDKLFVTLTHDALVIGRDGPANVDPSCHRLVQSLAASYVASVAVDVAAGLGRGYGGRLHVRFADLGLTRELLAQQVFLRGAVIAGAGAIGNGFLRALRHVNPSGSIIVADPKSVAAGNQNRCLYFDEGSVEKAKAEELCFRAQADFPNLGLEPFVGTFTNLRERDGRIRRVIVGVDSRRVRRTIQKELPLEVLDASTTGAAEVVVHSHRQPTEAACLACIYRYVAAESEREKDIAAGLGIDVRDVAGGSIDKQVARKIQESHPNLILEQLVGLSFDSLFRQLCALDALKTATGEQILAPFAFVSSIAGALLVVELLRFDSDTPPLTNYFYFSPWQEPNALARRRRPRVADCEFCSLPESREAISRVWSDALNEPCSSR